MAFESVTFVQVTLDRARLIEGGGADCAGYENARNPKQCHLSA